jgi:two-component system, OmpR family, copper resistance phosphate regulon response regulator CusR
VRQAEHLQLADLSLDPIRHKAYRDGQALDLTPKEFTLLALFMNRPGEVLSRTLIAEQVWDVHFDCDSNIIDVAIRRLRQKIDDPFPQKLLHTVRGMGYVLEQR